MEFHTSIFICIAFLSAYAVTIEIDVDTFREEIKQMIVNDATFREEIKMMIVNDATFRADIIQMIVQNKNFEWEVKLITFNEFDKQNTRFAQKLQNDTRNQVNEALQKLNEIEEQLKTLQERFSERGNCTVVCNGSNLHDWITTVNKNLTNIDIRIRELDGNRPDHKYNNNEELRRINEKFVQIDAHLHVIDNQVQRVNGRVYEHDCWLEPLCKQVDCGCGCDC